MHLAELSREEKEEGRLIDRSIEVRVLAAAIPYYGTATAHICIVVLVRLFYRVRARQASEIAQLIASEKSSTSLKRDPFRFAGIAVSGPV
jgi:hypothetical protein